jgi:hypothetical protein
MSLRHYVIVSWYLLCNDSVKLIFYAPSVIISPRYMSGYTPSLIGETPWTYNSTTSSIHSNSIGSPLGLAFSSIAEANNNRIEATNFALSTGQHNMLPTGTHQTSANTKIIRGNGYTRYENSNTKTGYVVRDDGQSGGMSGHYNW